MGLGPTRISTEGQRWIVTNTVLLPLALLAVVLRLYARKLRVKPLAFNDYTIILSLVWKISLRHDQVLIWSARSSLLASAQSRS